MRVHMALPVVALLGGCGRVGFDAVGNPDARGDATDSAPGSYAASVIADRPRAYYRLGDGGGLVLRDLVGSADAELETDSGGTVQLGRPGALANDTDTAVNFSADGNLGPRLSAWARLAEIWTAWDGDFTIEVFVRPIVAPPPGDMNAILVCEDYLNNGFRTGWGWTNNLSLWSTEAASTGDLDSTLPMTLGAWHHVAFIRRGATAEAFIDAVAVGSVAFDFLAPTASSECGFGSFHGMPSETDLDELAIYEVALTQAQLAAHVAASR